MSLFKVNYLQSAVSPYSFSPRYGHRHNELAAFFDTQSYVFSLFRQNFFK